MAESPFPRLGWRELSWREPCLLGYSAQLRCYLTHLPFGAHTPTHMGIHSPLNCAYFGGLLSGGSVSGKGTGG